MPIAEMPPKRDDEREKLEKQGVYLAPSLMAKITALAADNGISDGEQLRACVISGYAVEIEKVSRGKINRKLDQRQEKTFDALSRLKRAKTEEDRLLAIADLERCLTD